MIAQLLHRTQGNPTAILEAGIIEDAREFPREPLAEWGYLVDLDTETFVVYRHCPLGVDTFSFQDPTGMGEDWMHVSEFELYAEPHEDGTTP